MEAIALADGTAALFAAGGGPPADPALFARLDPARHPGLAGVLADAPPGPPADDLFPRVLTAILTAVLVP